MSAEKLFLTGAGGFIGRHLLERMDGSGRALVCLSRQPKPEEPGRDWVRGDLENPSSFSDALAGCEAVVHLGALTGKARAADYERVNVEGTRALLEASRRAGVKRFLYVSTIATHYPEKRRYPYARSKERGEGLVRSSALEWTIMRPTIVLGPDAPIWISLCKLARMPLTPVFGAGKVLVQPVAVRDVADCILTWVRRGRMRGQEIDVGGPEQLSFRDLLRRTRRALRGKDSGLVSIPLKSTMAALSLLEPFLLAALPLTAGQLYAFRYDSTAQPSDFMVQRRDRLMRIDALIEELARDA
jgi:NADH dehydrogenase